jgi:NAD-dependent dihydropyrimidine dehydrogenase PreA subunit
MTYLSGVVTLRFEPAACTGCGRCLEVCPRQVFVRQNGKVAVTDPDRCMECGACMTNCEHGALSVRAGVGCAAAVLNAMRRGGEPSCNCGSDAGSSGVCCE